MSDPVLPPRRAAGGAVRGAMVWLETTKADERPRRLADRHYTRQTIGHPMWTRPGYNQILYLEQRNGRAAAFCWWRPKWESGIPGTARKDGLRCIECALFRNETRFRSSDLIRAAVEAVLDWEHAADVDWPDGLITGISSAATGGGQGIRTPARPLLPGSRLGGVSASRSEQARRRVAPAARGGARSGAGAAPGPGPAGEVVLVREAHR